MTNTLIAGVGNNDISANVRQSPYYKVWSSMLHRCYSRAIHRQSPHYIGCKTIQDWHKLSTFKNWMSLQEWKGNVLDKDILVPGNKTYGPTTCVFISDELNKIIKANPRKPLGRLPGVTLGMDSHTHPFKASLSIQGKKVYLGRFSTEREAHIVFCKAKGNYLLEIANTISDSCIANGFRKHATLWLLRGDCK